MRGATWGFIPIVHFRNISIHAPHARSDPLPAFQALSRPYFNPRSSCEERQSPPDSCPSMAAFQSTLLMRGATLRTELAEHVADFNPRSSCEERRAITDVCSVSTPNFNPRSSCEERRYCSGTSSIFMYLFQSTLLMRGATASIVRIERIFLFQSTLLMRGATQH